MSFRPHNSFVWRPFDSLLCEEICRRIQKLLSSNGDRKCASPLVFVVSSGSGVAHFPDDFSNCIQHHLKAHTRLFALQIPCAQKR